MFVLKHAALPDLTLKPGLMGRWKHRTCWTELCRQVSAIDFAIVGLKLFGGGCAEQNAAQSDLGGAETLPVLPTEIEL